MWAPCSSLASRLSLSASDAGDLGCRAARSDTGRACNWQTESYFASAKTLRQDCAEWLDAKPLSLMPCLFCDMLCESHHAVSSCRKAKGGTASQHCRTVPARHLSHSDQSEYSVVFDYCMFMYACKSACPSAVAAVNAARHCFKSLCSLGASESRCHDAHAMQVGIRMFYKAAAASSLRSQDSG